MTPPDTRPRDLQPLRDWLAAHPAPDQQVRETRGGAVRVMADGSREMTMPWVAYDDTIPRFWAALDAAGWDEVDTSDYLATVERWQRAHRVTTVAASDLARMDRAALFNQLRWHNRGERFCDGMWADAFARGILHAGARAVIALR